jgi:hypothetical protein
MVANGGVRAHSSTRQPPLQAVLCHDIQSISIEWPAVHETHVLS